MEHLKAWGDDEKEGPFRQHRVLSEKEEKTEVNYRLSPSDLTFLYEGCKHCFVLKVKHGIGQPSIPLPAVFSAIAALQKDYYSEKRTEDFCPLIPPGVVKYGELWVRSRSVDLPGCASTCFIKGRFDIVAELDDGSYAVLDFKTGKPSDDKTKMYARQLHAYAMALEHPARNALQLSPVSKLGLLYFTPDAFKQEALTRQSLEGDMRCIEVARHDDAFLSFLGEVVRLLDGPLPPPETDRCAWCKYRTRTRGPTAPGEGEGKEAALPTCPQCKGPMQLKRGRFGEFWSCLSYPDCKGTRKA